MENTEDLSIDNLKIILDNMKIGLGKRLASFYADIDQRDFYTFEDSMFMFKWVHKILNRVKNDKVHREPLMKELLRKNSTNKNNSIERLYFEIATNLAFSKYALNGGDWKTGLNYLCQANRNYGTLLGIESKTINKLIHSDEKSRIVSIRHKNDNDLLEPIKFKALNLYHDLEYRKKHNLGKSRDGFALHFLTNYGGEYFSKNSDLKNLLTLNRVRAWIKESLEMKPTSSL